MPTSSVAVRSIALAVLDIGVVSAASGRGSNVTALAPCSDVGLPGIPAINSWPSGGGDRVDVLVPNS